MSSSEESKLRRRRAIPSSLGQVAPALLAIALISCSRSPETQTSTQSSQTETRKVQVSRVDLGRAVTADNRVITTTESFAPRDTVYAAVITTGTAPAAQVTARWVSEDGQIVSESTQTVSPNGTEGATQFHIISPGGLAPGRYKLEILVDGEVASTKEFTITSS